MAVRLRLSAGSSGRCNTSIKSFGWGCKSQSLAWSFVELPSHFVELGLRVHGQVSPLRQVLPKQTVGVFIGTTLPRTLRIAEVNVDVGRQRQAPMVRKLLAAEGARDFAAYESPKFATVMTQSAVVTKIEVVGGLPDELDGSLQQSLPSLVVEPKQPEGDYSRQPLKSRRQTSLSVRITPPSTIANSAVHCQARVASSSRSARTIALVRCAAYLGFLKHGDPPDFEAF